MVTLVLVGVIALLILLVIGLYNSLITARNRVDNAWSQPYVQLKRRQVRAERLRERDQGTPASRANLRG